MRTLVDKYPDGYEAWERENQDLIVSVNKENGLPNNGQLSIEMVDFTIVVSPPVPLCS
jgi:hypothetical protein